MGDKIKRILEGIKNLAYSILALAFFVGVFIFFFFIFGKSADYILKFYPYITSFTNFLLLFILPILLLLSFIKRTRVVGIVAIVYSSYAFGLALWCLGFIVTYAFWGLAGVFIGLFLLGIGVVPVGLLAALLHGEWMIIFNIIFGIILTFGIRYLGFYLADRADKEERDMEYSATPQITTVYEGVVEDVPVAYCHSCGIKSISGDIFCTSCGTKLKQ